ncbi:site-specific DNA-methyltransferase [Vagococcus lutrae]|uniref:site-specific DNA-methyltransferase n=1 Tax=Vagococcus lutrae TaxID=81947 RepID=UPI00200F452C|nr:site-specific DNA-methyltransferase [Vagococcus lutrae]UQF12319.1 site-specific DNA-methyltransferase [Vagococcus lutrae]
MIKDTWEKNENVSANKKEITVLKENFPACFKEDGSFDIERFKEYLSEDINVVNEGYELKFLGKNYARLLVTLETETVIVPNEEHNQKEENKDSENIYITGDNLDGLKHLLKSYAGKVKCIYIDPPYNTGSDGFVYNDNFNFTVEELTEKLSISEVQAQRILDLTKRGSASHSAWLMFIYPRLQLARDLLSDEGVIFMSIDKHEMVNLKLLSDEIFGEDNHIGEIIRNTNSSKNQALFLSTSHDYCLIYSKNISSLSEKHSSNKWSVPKNNVKEYMSYVNRLKNEGLSEEEITSELKQLTKYPRFVDFENYWYFDESGLYRKGDLGGVQNGNMEAILNPLTNELDPIPPGGYRYNKEKLEELINEDKIHFHTDGSLPTIKRYLSENMNQRPKAIMSDDQRPDDRLMKKYDTPFDNPKQLAFMKRILSIVDSDSIIVDFFSGSATTAHATMELNDEDGGDRKFIMVQIPEKVEKTSAAYKKGYKTIDELGRTRIKKAADDLKEKKPETRVDLGFKHFTLNEPTSEMINKLVEFTPKKDEMIINNTILDEFGVYTVITTWLNNDGYGLTAEAEKILFAGYESYFKDKHLYLVHPELPNEAIEELVVKYETDGNFNPENIVLFGYSFTWTELESLKTNLKRLQDTEKNLRINFDVRY